MSSNEEEFKGNWGDMSATSLETQHPSDDGLGLGVSENMVQLTDESSEEDIVIIQCLGEGVRRTQVVC